MDPIANMVKVWKYFWGLLMATSNFAFEVKALIGVESTQLEICVTKIGLNGPYD